MSFSVHMSRLGLLSGLRQRGTPWALNTTIKQIPRNFLHHNAPVVTAHPKYQTQTWGLAPRDQRTMCSTQHTGVDPFTKLPLKDPKMGDLIYSGPLSKTIRAVKLFSLSTSGLSLCMQPIILMRSAESSIALKIAFGGFFSFFIVMTPLLIHWVAKKYVTGVYFDEDSKTFTALKYSFICRQKVMTFTAEDVKVPEIAGPFTSLIVRGTALFMDPKFFLDKNAYIHLMGFDKPLDWELPKPKVEEPTEK